MLHVRFIFRSEAYTMTDHRSEQTDREITTADELTRALDEILVSAFENEVDVEGSYAIRNGPEHPDVEVEITELAKPDAEN